MKYNPEDLVVFNRTKITTIGDICVDLGYDSDSLEEAEDILDIYFKKGILKEYALDSKLEKKLSKAHKEAIIEEKAKQAKRTEEELKDKMAKIAKEDRLTHEEVEIEFPSYEAAKEFQKYLKEDLRLTDSTIEDRDDGLFIVMRDVTEGELKKISRKYQSDKIVKRSLNTIDKTVAGATGVIGYTAENIAAPIAKSALKGGVGLFKSLTKTLISTGAGVITATAEGVKETKEALNNDPEMLEARADIINIKDSINRRRGLKKFGRGINIK